MRVTRGAASRERWRVHASDKQLHKTQLRNTGSIYMWCVTAAVTPGQNRFVACWAAALSLIEIQPEPAPVAPNHVRRRRF